MKGLLLDTLTIPAVSNEAHNVREHKKTQLLHTLRPYKGHTLFEVDITAKEIRTIQPTKSAVISSSSPSDISTHKKVHTRVNCLYISCLNRKNLRRLIINAGGQDIKDFTMIK
jgi:hypothetical protein